MLNNNYSLSMWLSYLEKLDKKRKFNLIELKTIAKKMNLLNPKSFIFTVGGTNGKGTTCAMLEKLLLKSGYKVGLYTSPHLINYRERVKINGSILSEKQHIFAFQNVELARKKTLLTYFEFITLSALILFKKYFLDVIILEVGLGGRLDATNIIDSNLSIITNIGIDHISILGEDRLTIAREKSGIFRKNKISVIGESNIPISMIEVAKEKKTILKKVNVDWFWKNNNNYWHFIHPEIKLYNLLPTQIPLSNTATALSALYYAGFKIKEKIIRSSISNVKLSGRFEIISTCPYIILDVAHNPDAVLYLSKRIETLNIKGKIYGVVGVLKDKDIKGIINPLLNKIHHWYTAPLETLRTATITQLKKVFPLHKTSILNSIYEIYILLSVLANKDDAILVFGSFVTISEFIIAKNNNDNINI